MTIQDTIAANQQAVVDAQTHLDATNATLRDNEDKLVSLNTIETAANDLPHAGVKQAVLDLINQTKNA